MERTYIRKSEHPETDETEEDKNGKKKLEDLHVFYVSLVEQPAVPKAQYRFVKGANMEELKALLSSLSEQIAQYGSTIKAQQEQIDALVAKTEDVSVSDESEPSDNVVDEDISTLLAQLPDMLADASDEEINAVSTLVETLLGEEDNA